MQNAEILDAWLLNMTKQSFMDSHLWETLKCTRTHTHTGLLFIFANKQQKQIGQTPQFKHEHFSKRGGDWREIQERFSIHSDIRAWRYTQHSYRTDGSTGNEVIAPNLADLVRGQISDQHRTAGNLGQFHAASGSCCRGPQVLGQTRSSTWTQRAYLTRKMNGKLTSIQSPFIQKDVQNKLEAIFRTAQKLYYVWLAFFQEHWKKYGNTLEIFPKKSFFHLMVSLSIFHW